MGVAFLSKPSWKKLVEINVHNDQPVGHIVL